MNLELLVGRPSGSALANDYTAGSPVARAFFEGWWGDPEAYLAKAAEVRGRFDRAARERAARALVAPSPAAALRLEAWVERGGLAVTTGQQPGLFTGPLYTLYKALSAARLARALEEMLETPVLPIFWVASEDHDWRESNHAVVVGSANDLTRIEVEAPEGQEGQAIHRIRLDAELADAVEQLLAQLPATEFAPPLAELLRSAYAPGATLSGAFGSVLSALLEPWGVFLTDAAHPAVKEGSAWLLARELEQAEAHEALLAARAEALQEAGYELQVPVLPGGVNLFVEGPAGRERLYRSDGRFQLRHSGETLSAGELTERLQREPGALSPNVLLRPVVESAVFPTVSIVVGPGETAYFGQLAPYFEAFGILPPVAYPRFGATAVEGKVQKVLDKFSMDVAGLRRPFHEVAAEISRDELPDAIKGSLARVRATIDAESERLAASVQEIHTTLAGTVQRARSASVDAWADAEKKVLQALRRENETRLAQLEKAQLHVFPQGKPQERVLNVFYYLFRYGPAFLERVSEAFEVELGAGAPHG